MCVCVCVCVRVCVPYLIDSLHAKYKSMKNYNLFILYYLIQRSSLTLNTDKIIMFFICYIFHAQNHLLCSLYYFDWL